MSSDKLKRVWGAVKAKWGSIKPKLQSAWAKTSNVTIKFCKQISKIAKWVHRFASQSPVLIAAIAIIACVFMIIICSVAYSFLFSTTLSFDRFGRISLGVTALFTLGVVIWRGILHAKQEQHQAEQLRETENNNVVKLLVDGIKLLGNDTSEAEKMAGIACLASILEGHSPYAHQAFTLIKAYFFSFMSDSNNTSDVVVRDNGTIVYMGSNDVINTALSVMSYYAHKNNFYIDLRGIWIKNAIFHGGEFYQQFEDVWYDRCEFNSIPMTITDTFKMTDCIVIRCELEAQYIVGSGNQLFFCVFKQLTPHIKEKVKKADVFDCYYDENLIETSFIKEFYCGYDITPLRGRPKAHEPLIFQSTF